MTGFVFLFCLLFRWGILHRVLWWLGDAGSCVQVVSFVWVLTVWYSLGLVLWLSRILESVPPLQRLRAWSLSYSYPISKCSQLCLQNTSRIQPLLVQATNTASLDYCNSFCCWPLQSVLNVAALRSSENRAWVPRCCARAKAKHPVNPSSFSTLHGLLTVVASLDAEPSLVVEHEL